MCVCVLTTMAQIITTIPKDLQSWVHRPTDELFDLVYRVCRSSCLYSYPASWALHPMGFLLFRCVLD